MLAYALIVYLFVYVHCLQVNTTEGPVEGYISLNGRYFEFHGIPYAGPTSGQNRFKGPVPPLHRSGLFHANDSTVICAHPTPYVMQGVEDCLTLNVVTSSTTSSMPVIVFLNSEKYNHPSISEYSVLTFVEHDVVFVAMNHRLSIFGFLCLGIQEAPGNAGLKDVIQGLKWIKANIANFGGDPNNVILLGHGSGAAMVDLLTLSPQTRNLVHKGIAFSGSGLAPWAVAYDPVGYARMFAANLGYYNECSADLAKRLINTNKDSFNDAFKTLNFYNNTPLFAPCIEDPKLNPNDTVLAEAPINALRSGKYAQMPFIYGYTTMEGSMRAGEAMSGWLGAMQANFTDFLPVDLQFGNNKTAVARQIRELYFGNSTVSMKTVDDFLKYEGDTLALVPVIKTAKERALTSTNKVRLLEFGYEGLAKFLWFYDKIPLTGANHEAIVDFMFDSTEPIVYFDNSLLRETFVIRLTAFAHNWRLATNAAIWPASWPAITENTINYLCCGPENSTINYTNLDYSYFTEEVKFDPYVQVMNFWDNLYAKYYVAPSKLKPSNDTLYCHSSVPNSLGLTFSCIFLVLISHALVGTVGLN